MSIVYSQYANGGVVPKYGRVQFAGALGNESPTKCNDPSYGRVTKTCYSGLPTTSQYYRASYLQSLVSYHDRCRRAYVPGLFRAHGRGSIVFYSPTNYSRQSVRCACPVVSLVLRGPTGDLWGVFFPTVSHSIRRLRGCRTAPKNGSSSPSFQDPSIATGSPACVNSVEVVVVESSAVSSRVLGHGCSPYGVCVEGGPNVRGARARILSYVSKVV